MKMGDRFRFKGVILGVILSSLCISGCSQNSSTSANSASDLLGEEPGEVALRVNGAALFGSQCPFGSYSGPQERPIELWKCPLNLNEVDLQEPLQPLILQADCKKKIIDVRADAHAVTGTTWEMMPDGSFYFMVNSGVAKLKTDGAGNFDCTTPLAAEMWGKVDCTDRDKAIINLETVWWLGEAVTEPSPLPSPSSSFSSLPIFSPTPTPIGSSSPIIPGPVTSPTPATTTPSARPSFFPPRGSLHTLHLPQMRAVPTARSCRLPEGCYFHAITQINQCP